MAKEKVDQQTSVNPLLLELIETIHYVAPDWPDLDQPPPGWIEANEEEDVDDEGEDGDEGSEEDQEETDGVGLETSEEE